MEVAWESSTKMWLIHALRTNASHKLALESVQFQMMDKSSCSLLNFSVLSSEPPSSQIVCVFGVLSVSTASMLSFFRVSHSFKKTCPIPDLTILSMSS